MSARAATAPLFWNLANGVTIFAVVQMIAYLMALGADGSTIHKGVLEIYRLILPAIIVATLFYCGAVAYFSWCHHQLLEGVDTSRARMLFVTAALRIVVVAATGLGGYGITELIVCDAQGAGTAGGQSLSECSALGAFVD